MLWQDTFGLTDTDSGHLHEKGEVETTMGTVFVISFKIIVGQGWMLTLRDKRMIYVCGQINLNFSTLPSLSDTFINPKKKKNQIVEL